MGGARIAQHHDAAGVGGEYQLAYDAAPIAMLVTTQDGVVVDGNPTFLAWSGYSRDEILGRAITDLYVDPAARAELLDVFRSRGSIGPLELRFRRKSGEVVVGRIHTETLCVPGDASLLFTAIEDVTRLTELRDRFFANLAEYRQLFEQSRDAIVVTSADGTVVDANPAAHELFEAPGEAFPRKAVDLYASSAARELLLAELRRVGSVRAEDVHFRTITGREFVGEITSVVRRDASGAVIGTQGTIRDVTDRRRTEQLLRTLLNGSPLAIIGTDIDGRVTLWNPAAERLYGWSEAEMLGSSLARIVPAEQRAEFDELRARTLAGDPPQMYETWRTRRSGERFRALLSFAALRENGSGVVGVMAVAEDVTERRRIEMQLWQSQKFEALGRLAGGVAHDFNNLLTVVLAEAATIRAHAPDGSEPQASAKEIEEAARRGAALTRQLLAVSRQQVLSPSPVDLGAIVGESERMLRRLIAENVEIRIALSDDLWLVRADQSQLHQILLNLALNARDAMPDGGTLTIAARNRTLAATRWCVDGVVEPGEYVELTVSDTGAGMDEATVASVFEPFFTTKAGSGTGLGLPTVLGIVKQSRGGIEIHSRVGDGTAFVVLLPRSTDAVVAFADPPRVARTDVGRTVLLVEDEPAVREVTRRLLEGAGFRVLTAADGDLALELADTTDATIDVLVTDAVMPHVGGALLASALTARRPRLAVVFVSGYADADAVAHARADGSEFVEKPFSGDALLGAIRRALSRAAARQA